MSNHTDNGDQKFQKYLPEFCDLVEEMVSKGVTVTTIAKELNINRTRFYKWLHRYPEFKEAYMNGLQNRAIDVEMQLFHEAEGYEVTERIVDPDGGTTTKTKYIRPSFPAQKYILENKRGEYWKEKSEVDVNVKNIIVKTPDFIEPILNGDLIEE